jgi:hypothetical protein
MIEICQEKMDVTFSPSAVTVLGSYGLDFWVHDIDPLAQSATITFHVYNTTSLISGTRPPVIGYTAFWSKYVAPIIGSLSQSGATSPVTQDFYWEQPISYAVCHFPQSGADVANNPYVNAGGVFGGSEGW